MVTQSRRTGVASAVAMVTVLAAMNGARAADMPMAPPIEVVDDTPVNFATSWYIRGDAALTEDTKIRIGDISSPDNSNFGNSWSVGGGFGYKFNDWFRTDVTLDWRNPRYAQGMTQMGVVCQTSMYKTFVMNDSLGAPLYRIDNAYDAVGCADAVKSRITVLHMLFNGYIDLGTWHGFTPYVGAGVGWSLIYQKTAQSWQTMSNGLPYLPAWTNPISQVPESRNWNMYKSTSDLHLAYAGMAGVSYAMTDHAAIDFGYRYLSLGHYRNNIAGYKKHIQAHELRLGLRYTPD